MSELPQFSIDFTQFVHRLNNLLNANLETIHRLLEQSQFSWKNLMQPLETMEAAIEQVWSPFAHLHAVKNTIELRKIYQECLPLLSAYEATIGHNHALFSAISMLPKEDLNEVQQKIIADALQNFKLAGVALPTEEKRRYEEIQTRLSELNNQFENNLLDAEQAFSLFIADPKRVEGLPAHALQTASELAKQKGLSGWVFNLEIPCYLAIMTYANDRDLRETMYQAYVTRASDQGPQANQFDNTAIIDEILSLRHEKAQLLGFNNYAELSLASKMAKSTEEVMRFLLDLAHLAKPQAQAEFAALQQFAQTSADMDSLKPWDITYYSEKLRQQQFAVSQEELRDYFPLEQVLKGIFIIIQRLYRVKFQLIPSVKAWHPDVRCYQLLNAQDQIQGYIYIDLFARPHKRGGAWMDALQTRWIQANSEVQYPIATLTCNFAKAGENATLSHEEVLTLFHEFGHCLHHLLTQIDYFNASGIHGVEWDAVELPSQIFENWCWEEETIQLISAHKDTGEALPKNLYNKLLAAKNFQAGLNIIRQIEFSLFDFQIHKDYENSPHFVANTLQTIRTEIAVVPIMPYNRFQHSFSHVFAGGYCAGYYSYKWAEVLSSDAYARFEEEGIFNPQTGEDFLHTILEVGGAKKASDAFIAFRGREPNFNAFLKHNGFK